MDNDCFITRVEPPQKRRLTVQRRSADSTQTTSSIDINIPSAAATATAAHRSSNTLSVSGPNRLPGSQSVNPRSAANTTPTTSNNVPRTNTQRQPSRSTRGCQTTKFIVRVLRGFECKATQTEPTSRATRKRRNTTG